MTDSRLYVLPPESRFDESLDENIQYPRHTDLDGAEQYGSALAPPPASYSGSTTADGEAYWARVHASQAAHDTIQGDEDTLLVGEMPEADVPPSAAASALNGKFRPQSEQEFLNREYKQAGVSSWSDFKPARDDLRDLDPDEWASRLGGGSGAFTE